MKRDIALQCFDKRKSTKRVDCENKTKSKYLLNSKMKLMFRK